MEHVITLLLYTATAYAGTGAVFACLFVWRGVARIDSVARDATIGFRLLIIPGAAALWPLLLLRWWHTTRKPGG